jgi:hypothetical protein
MIALLLVLVLVLGWILVHFWVQLVRERRAQFVRTFSLPPGLYQKLQEKHPQLSLKDCQLVGHALRHFFLAWLWTRQHVSMPSQVVDDLWHEFILHTRSYEIFCRQAFGGFLHHTPAAAFGRGVQEDNTGLQRCWWQVCREENVHPLKPTRLPLLFAIDRKFSIRDGFIYALDCENEVEVAKLAATGAKVHCAMHLRPIRQPRAASGCSGGGCSGGGGHGCSGDGGSSCGGGGCGGH